MTHFLHVDVLSCGGEYCLRKTLWWPSGIISMGGCVVQFALAKKEGGVEAAGTLRKLSQVNYKMGQASELVFEDLTPEGKRERLVVVSPYQFP